MKACRATQRGRAPCTVFMVIEVGSQVVVSERILLTEDSCCEVLTSPYFFERILLLPTVVKKPKEGLGSRPREILRSLLSCNSSASRDQGSYLLPSG